MHSNTRRSLPVRHTGGFTLIELLIVIGILGILASIVLVAVDPAKRLKQARNARRSSEVNAILNAILNYTVDNKGTLPTAISSSTSVGIVQLIGNSGTNTVATAANSTVCPYATTGVTGTPGYWMANLAADTAFVDTYIAQMPIDPQGTSSAGTVYNNSLTGYYVLRTANGRVQVGACNSEDEGSGVVPISVKR